MMKEMGIIKGMLTDAKGDWSAMRGMSWATLIAAIAYVATCLVQGVPIQLDVLLSLLGISFGGKLIQKPMESKPDELPAGDNTLL